MMGALLYQEWAPLQQGHEGQPMHNVFYFETLERFPSHFRDKQYRATCPASNQATLKSILHSFVEREGTRVLVSQPQATLYHSVFGMELHSNECNSPIVLRPYERESEKREEREIKGWIKQLNTANASLSLNSGSASRRFPQRAGHAIVFFPLVT